MVGNPSSGPSSSKGSVVMDVKPIRTLAPLFPSAVGLKPSHPPTDSPSFVCVTPFGSFAAGWDAGLPSNFFPLFPTLANPSPVNDIPLNPMPLRAVTSAGHAVAGGSGATVTEPVVQDDPYFSASGRKIKRPMHIDGHQVSGGSVAKNTDEKKVRPKKAKQVHDGNKIVLPYFSSLDDPREAVEAIMMTFDGLRRRAMQMDEAKDVNRRADLRVGTIMMKNDLRTNLVRRIGAVPGLEVGDMFYFRFEMLLVGLHSQVMAGIDRMTARFGNEDDTVAVAIVSAGGYENEDEDVDVLLYSGQGGASGRNDKKADDQKLERGNLALERSLHRANEIRVIRGAKDFSCQNGKIYIYDGLYKVRESWVEKGKAGFNMFKFKLLRKPGQPDGIAVWKRTRQWIENPSLRGKVILPDISSGSENIPVCLVNEVDNEKGPNHFTYVKCLGPISSMKPLQSCMCQSVCLPVDAGCSCAQQNGGPPYSSNGLLVSRKPLIYECSASCPCSLNCRNRVTQKGIRLHFEVFKTWNRGWGLRSWDPIRAGTFICEYTGEVIDKNNQNNLYIDIAENDYIFQKLSDDKASRWNYIPELLDEPSHAESSETSGSLPIIINAKSMGNVARFMNHSCSPNVFWQPVLHDHGDQGFPHIMFFAIKHIPPMTELTYDYCLNTTEIGSKESENGAGLRRTLKCLCGQSKCRGFFG